eukprot:TRINITY_DN4194_c0_g1_i1.p1 TRINITY_DN4194_c0_g1~~TRINITY_DN4194_c0_g1_i1.p1  ORF type:complete len:469 (-),score=89.02 TRINITY_DN4194_c0_g1_i1:199-1431(-)
MEAEEWTQIHFHRTTAPPVRHSHTAIIHSGFMYVYGGISSAGAILGDLFRFHFDTRKWENIPTNVQGLERWGHTAVVYKDRMIVFGGMSNSTFENSMLELDLNTHKWRKVNPTGKIPKVRQFHSACVHGEYMYIICGFANNDNYCDMHRFNLEIQRWEPCDAIPPFKTRAHTSVTRGNSIYVFGGFSGKQINDLFEYSVETGKWEKLNCRGNPPSSRHFHTAVLYSDIMYITGGFSHNQNRNDVHQFFFETSRQQVDSSQVGRDLASLLTNPKFSDISFDVDGQMFPAHRAIMYARSPHFAALIDNGMRESKQSDIAIEDVSAPTFRCILDHIYSGSCNIDETIAQDVFVASDKFLLSDLKSAAEMFLIQGLSIDNVASLMHLGEMYSAPYLQQRCKQLISEHSEQSTSD